MRSARVAPIRYAVGQDFGTVAIVFVNLVFTVVFRVKHATRGFAKFFVPMKMQHFCVTRRLRRFGTYKLPDILPDDSFG